MTTQNRQQSNAKKNKKTKHKSIVLRDCRMQILFEKKCGSFDFLPSFCWTLPAKNQPLLDYFWNISIDWKRLQRTKSQLCMGDCFYVKRNETSFRNGRSVSCHSVWNPRVRVFSKRCAGNINVVSVYLYKSNYIHPNENKQWHI